MTPTVPAPTSRAHTELVRQLCGHALQDPQAFHEMALRTRSPDVLDAVAALAVPGSRAPALREVGRAVAGALDPAQLAPLAADSRWLSELAALSAIQVTGQTPDLLAAWGLWQWAAGPGGEQLPPRHRDLRAQVAWVLRERLGPEAVDRVASWVAQEDLLGPEVRAELRADLANPWLSDPGAASGATWADRCAQILGPRLGPLQVPAGPGAPFDRLSSPATGRAVGDRQVAVILTTYRPDHSLLTAVRSVLAQTWQEWTLLLVDDASGPAYDAVLAEAAALDDRVRLFRREVNGGTYAARNTGLRQVGTADFVTFHDSDDWSHPQRLELTLEPLRAESSTVATTAWALKATEDLELTRLGYRGISRMAVSLVVRRDPVCSDLGFFDPVRKSADKEFQRRIMAAYPDGLAEVRDPVAVIRRGHDSLSATDHSRGWRHHSRRHYQQAYQPWHRRIRRGQAAPHLDDTAERTFWAPRRWLPQGTGSAGQGADRYAVVLAADYARPDTAEVAEPLIDRARRHGRRVGLLQVDGPVLHGSPEPPTAASVVRRVARGQVGWVYLDDRVVVDHVVVLDATVLHPGPDLVATWAAPRVDLVLPPEETTLDRRAAERRATTMFGTAPRWWDPASEAWPSPAQDASGDGRRQLADDDRDVGTESLEQPAD